jgi:hypothetical protein
MKSLPLAIVLAFFMLSCAKQESELQLTPTLDVEKKNMGVYGIWTTTTCFACGDRLNASHNLWEQNRNVAVGMAFKYAFTGSNGPHSVWGTHLFDLFGPQFGLEPGWPQDFSNFMSGTVAEHLSNDVILNGNYELKFEGNEITINTTTKFFSDFTGDVYLAPFIIVDNLVGHQVGHPDTTNTVHQRYVADVAYLANKDVNSKQEWGYLISSQSVRDGHTLNLKFKAQKMNHWNNSDISIAMIYFKKAGNQYVFLNAFDK